MAPLCIGGCSRRRCRFQALRFNLADMLIRKRNRSPSYHHACSSSWKAERSPSSTATHAHRQKGGTTHRRAARRSPRAGRWRMEAATGRKARVSMLQERALALAHDAPDRRGGGACFRVPGAEPDALAAQRAGDEEQPVQHLASGPQVLAHQLGGGRAHGCQRQSLLLRDNKNMVYWNEVQQASKLLHNCRIGAMRTRSSSSSSVQQGIR